MIFWLYDLWPHIHQCIMCTSPQWSPTPMVIHQSMWIQWFFFQTKRSITFDPHFCWMSHVRPYPRIILSKSHENTSKFVDTTDIHQRYQTSYTVHVIVSSAIGLNLGVFADPTRKSKRKTNALTIYRNTPLWIVECITKSIVIQHTGFEISQWLYFKNFWPKG